MPDEITSVYDDLARVTAQIDQAQAQINEGRSKFSGDQHWQLELDRMQTELDERKDRVKLMRRISDFVYKK